MIYCELGTNLFIVLLPFLVDLRIQAINTIKVNNRTPPVDHNIMTTVSIWRPPLLTSYPVGSSVYVTLDVDKSKMKKNPLKNVSL